SSTRFFRFLFRHPRTLPLFPYTTLFRSRHDHVDGLELAVPPRRFATFSARSTNRRRVTPNSSGSAGYARGLGRPSAVTAPPRPARTRLRSKSRPLRTAPRAPRRRYPP